jgi:hypothetical protein
VDEVDGITDLDLQELYDCLFSCDLKFGNLGSCKKYVLGHAPKGQGGQELPRC